METGALQRPLELSVGIVAGIAIVQLATGEWPGIGFLLGLGLVPVLVVALSRIDGPLERRTARIGAVVVSVGLLGAALWLSI